MIIYLRRIDIEIILKALACMMSDKDILDHDKNMANNLKRFLLHEYRKE